MDKKFSLKDMLFNEQKVNKIAQEIKAVYPGFDADNFAKDTLVKFPQLELKQRIAWISEMLQHYLPANYPQAIRILLDALPPPNDPSKADNDFGDFIYAPYADFAAKYGCTREHLQLSLEALKEITMRFSAEDAIRYFINAFPDETLTALHQWSQDPHYHVRRLASEGTRPKLPWAQKLTIPIEKALPILDNLFTDKTRFVTRSVANHLNDISKIQPDLVIDTLNRWQQSDQQTPKEMEYIIRHALRTLVKQGYKPAVEFLQFSAEPDVTISAVVIKQTPVVIGEAVEFEFTLTANRDERLIIDYVLYFQSKAGTNNNNKVFKIKQIEMKADQTVIIRKRHPLLKNMTTRKLYPGKHILEIQINGVKMATASFDLIETAT